MAGVILGTAAYMSPEQANGKEADSSADVWAFGCVLYEMLTGRRAFDGDTVSETIASVLKTEPAWQQLPAETPHGVRRLLRRSLQKDHKLRFRDIRDARLELADAQSATPEKDNVTGVRSRRGERLAWASALAIVAGIAGVLGVRGFSPTPVAPETNLTITTPPTRDATLAISPDGLKVVFVARSGGQSQLWLRLLDSPTARPGARIVEELNETCYGERQYSVEDLGGHHWLFSTHVQDLSPADWGATMGSPTER